MGSDRMRVRHPGCPGLLMKAVSCFETPRCLARYVCVDSLRETLGKGTNKEGF